MSLGVSHRRIVIAALFVALAAGGASARRLRPLANEVVKLQVDDTVIGDDVIADDMLIDQAYQHLKLIGADSQALELPFAALVSAGREGIVDEASVYAIISLYADPQVQAKAEAVSHGLAEALAYGQVPGQLVDIIPALDVRRGKGDAEDLGTLAADEEALAPGLRDEMPRPALAGVCLACPSFNFGPFTPTTTCQSHSSSTSASGDCNTYLFNVTPGRLYEFSTCSTSGACGSGGFDTVIEVRNQSACGTIVASNDDNCGLQSRVTYCVPFGVSQLSVKVRGFSTTFGSYSLSYRDAGACTACYSCAVPKYTAVPNPDATCRFVNGTITTCQDEYYQFTLTSGQTYDFSTCNSLPPSCPSSTNTVDTVLEAWSPTCVLTASQDDATGCSNLRGSHLILTPTISGPWRIRVRGFGSATGAYRLAYQQRVGCQSPSIASLTPTTSSTNTTNCQRTQTFAASVTLGSGPVTVNFTVTPGAGNSASPTTGSVVLASGTGTANFTTTLTKGACAAGSFTVSAVATNACGTSTRTITHVLTDTIAPVMTPSCVTQTTTVACDAPLPPIVPRTATDNCDPAPTVTFTETRTNLSCPANYNLVRRWTARDCRPNQAICTQTIQVRDTVGPTITAPDTARCVHPPNHEYKCYSTSIFAPTVVDTCSAVAGLVITGCSSNEPDEGTGDGDFPNDCIVSPSGDQVCVRAERAGSENDRLYALLGRARDACGNVGPEGAVALIRVPHDDADHPECDPADSGLAKRF